MSDSGGEKNRDIWNDGIQNYSSNSYTIGLQSSNRGNIYVNQEPHLINNVQQPLNSQGNYTMLSVGHGNYLKVYHNNDERDDYNKQYELFSSNSFIPTHTMISQPANSNPTQCFSNNRAELRNINENNVSANTSLFLNQLVGNLGSQNMSGTYSPFGEPMTLPNSSNSIQPNQGFSTTLMNVSNKTDDLNNELDKFLNDNKIQHKTKQTADVIKKPRIIAEVKPMRMSYSDVLSQNVSLNENVENPNNISNNNASNVSLNGNGNGTPIKSSKTADKTNKNFNYDKKNEDRDSLQNRTNPKKNSGSTKPNQSDSNKEINIEKDKKTSSVLNEDNVTSGNEENVKPNQKKRGKKSNNNSNSNTKKNSNQHSDKKKQKIIFEMYDDDEANEDDDDDDDEDDDDDIDVDYIANRDQCYYNVAKTVNDNTDKLSHRTKRHKSTVNTSNRTSSSKYEKMGYTKRYQKTRRNRKYVFMIKFFEKWMEYMMKILTWLFSLISDVVLLSFSIALDRLNSLWQYIVNLYHSIRNEMKTNSVFSTNWIKKIYKKFDSKFSKTSKLAFWRKIFSKKKVVENVSDFYKNGRLPQTGDEAMYSLLNCKGKDAYSILGVSADCSQEQIRKHYKKIAVLVHPDKNKQPGAEEAFKILQRAFELIGEPENRKAYDQSVAEALNAEKAWSELNDLLAQLHTKIAEAANTIRCSSCGLRHPRKPTGRPHYAARECNSCKIRHSAREGDIWAETNFFGLRWKYLALMEGTVYDITEWANCQKGALSHLQPNSHIVQYRIVLGSQQQHQQQQSEKEKHKKGTIPQTEPNLDEFLNNLYAGSGNQQNSSSRRRSKKN